MTAQTEILTSSEIHARTQALLAKNDIAGMQALVAEVFSSHYHEDNQDELVHAILSVDNLKMAKACFDAQVIKEWSDENDEFMILNCPEVFSEWAEATASVVASIGRALEPLPTEERREILEGRSSRVPGACLHSALTDEPEYWKHLTPTWIGAAGSPTRQAATGLGWKPSMLRAMVSSFLHGRPTASWNESLDYPRSLFVAVFTLNRMAFESRQQQQRQQGLLTGKPVNVAQMQIECEANANPWDVELALELARQTGFKHVFKPHADMPRLEPEDREHLKSIVEMHISLACLDVLADSLCHDIVPGLQKSDAVELSLPDSYDSLEKR